MEANAKLDYKKKYKDLYQPKTTGMLINVAAIPFLMVDGKGIRMRRMVITARRCSCFTVSPSPSK